MLMESIAVMSATATTSLKMIRPTCVHLSISVNPAGGIAGLGRSVRAIPKADREKSQEWRFWHLSCGRTESATNWGLC